MNANYDLNSFKKSGVILTRNLNGDGMVNIPQYVIYHSPDGFEWGYAGSGPADLALNIIEHYLQVTKFTGGRVNLFRGSAFKLAVQLHQQFKEDVIATLSHQSHVIPFAEIEGWITPRLSHLASLDDGVIDENYNPDEDEGYDPDEDDDDYEDDDYEDDDYEDDEDDEDYDPDEDDEDVFLGGNDTPR